MPKVLCRKFCASESHIKLYGIINFNPHFCCCLIGTNQNLSRPSRNSIPFSTSCEAQNTDAEVHLLPDLNSTWLSYWITTTEMEIINRIFYPVNRIPVISVHQSTIIIITHTFQVQDIEPPKQMITPYFLHMNAFFWRRPVISGPKPSNPERTKPARTILERLSREFQAFVISG